MNYVRNTNWIRVEFIYAKSSFYCINLGNSAEHFLFLPNKNRQTSDFTEFAENKKMPRVGVEPTWGCPRQILSLVRIPISPPRQRTNFEYKTSEAW